MLYDIDGGQTTIYSKTMPYNGGLSNDQISDYDEETYDYYYEYDLVGNLLWNEDYEYIWENGRELASITDKSTQAIVASFEYDSDGLRISKTTSQSGTVYYVYDENSNLIFERHSDYILAFHYDGNGIRTHFDHITDSATSTYYYRYNLQGDVIALLNSSGMVVQEYEYDPYGIQLTTASGIGAINPFRYRGYYYDSETGYYYLQSRYYDPTICRFINTDDISFLGASGTLLGLNLYIYCENDPINRVDYEGNVWAYDFITRTRKIRVPKITGWWIFKKTTYTTKIVTEVVRVRVYIPDPPGNINGKAYKTPLNPFAGRGLTQSNNCTLYAWGRAYEITGGKSVVSAGAPWQWYKTTSFKTGQKIKRFSVAVFKRHVLIIEDLEMQKNGNLKIWVTEGGSTYYGYGLHYYSSEAQFISSNEKYGGEFIGYIYLR